MPHPLIEPYLVRKKKHYSQGLSVDYNAFYYFSNIMSGSFSEFIFTLLILMTSCE